MKYTVQRLDGRFSYRKWFDYYIGFSGRMSSHHGPLEFTRAQKWFFDTYGWSAEIRIWSDIHKWTTQTNTVQRTIRPYIPATGILPQLPPECNPHWSWTNGYDDLRIYVAGEKELSFFLLAHPESA